MLTPCAPATAKSLGGQDKGSSQFNVCFSRPSAAEWLLDFTSARCRTEPRYILAHFVRLGLIELVEHHAMPNDCASVVVKKSNVRLSNNNDVFVVTDSAHCRLSTASSKAQRPYIGSRQQVPSLRGTLNHTRLSEAKGTLRHPLMSR